MVLKLGENPKDRNKVEVVLQMEQKLHREVGASSQSKHRIGLSMRKEGKARRKFWSELRVSRQRSTVVPNASGWPRQCVAHAL